MQRSTEGIAFINSATFMEWSFLCWQNLLLVVTEELHEVGLGLSFFTAIRRDAEFWAVDVSNAKFGGKTRERALANPYFIETGFARTSTMRRMPEWSNVSKKPSTNVLRIRWCKPRLNLLRFLGSIGNKFLKLTVPAYHGIWCRHPSTAAEALSFRTWTRCKHSTCGIAVHVCCLSRSKRGQG